MKSIVESLTFIAKEQIQRDIEYTKDCPAGVGLDQSTMRTLHHLAVLKALSLADDLSSIVERAIKKRLSGKN